MSGDDRALLNQNGAVTARLTPGQRPGPVRGVARFLSAAPTIDPMLRAAYPTSGLARPATFHPATATMLTGRWVPTGFSGTPAAHQPFLSFNPDGAWQGSDGCNGSAGLWAIGPLGALVSTPSDTTAVGCNGKPVEVWMQKTQRAGFQRHLLVLYNGAGHKLGELARGQK